MSNLYNPYDEAENRARPPRNVQARPGPHDSDRHGIWRKCARGG